MLDAASSLLSMVHPLSQLTDTSDDNRARPFISTPSLVSPPPMPNESTDTLSPLLPCDENGSRSVASTPSLSSPLPMPNEVTDTLSPSLPSDALRAYRAPDANSTPPLSSPPPMQNEVTDTLSPLLRSHAFDGDTAPDAHSTPSLSSPPPMPNEFTHTLSLRLPCDENHPRSIISTSSLSSPPPMPNELTDTETISPHLPLHAFDEDTAPDAHMSDLLVTECTKSVQPLQVPTSHLGSGSALASPPKLASRTTPPQEPRFNLSRTKPKPHQRASRIPRILQPSAVPALTTSCSSASTNDAKFGITYGHTLYDVLIHVRARHSSRLCDTTPLHLPLSTIKKELLTLTQPHTTSTSIHWRFFSMPTHHPCLYNAGVLQQRHGAHFSDRCPHR